MRRVCKEEEEEEAEERESSIIKFYNLTQWPGRPSGGPSVDWPNPSFASSLSKCPQLDRFAAWW